MARESHDYGDMAVLGQRRCIDIVEEQRESSERAGKIDAFTECWYYTGSTNTHGYGQVFAKQNLHEHLHGRSAQTGFSMHRVVFTARTGYNVPDGKHASHLCNHPSCFNPARLEEETPRENNSRKGCPGEIYCSVHGHAIVDLCTHRPHCIRAPREDVTCCLAMREQDPMGWASQQTRRTASRTTSRQSSRQSTTEFGSQLTQYSRYGGTSVIEEAIEYAFVAVRAHNLKLLPRRHP